MKSYFERWDDQDEYSDEFGRDPDNVPQATSMEKAKLVMELLESDSNIMDDFNFLMRQKKLRQLKENKKL